MTAKNPFTGCMRRPLTTLTLSLTLAGAATGADSTWNASGDNPQWTNPDNWSNGVPSFGDRVSFNRGPAGGPSFSESVFVEFNTTASVGQMFISDWIGSFGNVREYALRMNGGSGTRLTVGGGLYVTSDTETNVDSGAVSFRAEQMDLRVGSLIVEELASTEAVMQIDDSYVKVAGGLEVTSGAVVSLTDNSVLQVGSTVTGTGSIALNSGSALYIGDPAVGGFYTDTIGTAISGTGAVVIQGRNHTVDFSQSNSFSGGLYLLGGTLRVASGPQTGSLSNTLKFNGGTLEPTSNYTIGIPVTVGPDGGRIDTDHDNTSTENWSSDGGAGRMRKTGAGTLTLQGNNNAFIGDWLVEEGTLAVGVGNSLGSQTRVTIQPGASVTIQAAEDFGSLAGSGVLDVDFPVNLGTDDTSTTFSGSIVGPGDLGKVGEGTFHINGNLAGFSGTLRARSGTLQLSVPTSGTTSILFEGGTLEAAASIVIPSAVDVGSPAEIDVGGNTLTLAGPLSGDAEIVTVAEGTLRLMDFGTFVGPINVDAGTLGLGESPSPASRIRLSGTKLSSVADLFLQAPVLIRTSGGIFDTNGNSITSIGSISGLGPLTKDGEGRWQVSGNMTGFSGDLNVLEGEVNLVSTLAETTNVDIASAGHVTLGSSIHAWAMLTGNGKVRLLENQRLVLGGQDDSMSFNGHLTGAGTLVKSGTGNLQLRRGNPDFSGVFEVAGGSLEFTNQFGPPANGTGEIIVRDGGALIGRWATAGGTTTIETGGRVAPGDASSSLGRLEFEDFELQSGGTLEIQIAGARDAFGSANTRGASTDFDSIAATGTATLAGMIDVALIDEFVPAEGDTWDIVSAAGGIVSGLETFQLPELPAGLLWEVNRTNTVLSLLISVESILEADFDKDGDVDGEDFLVWQANFNQSGPHSTNTGDADGDGDVDGEDFLKWQEQFGSTAGSGNGAPVPEPATLMTLLITVVGLLAGRNAQSSSPSVRDESFVLDVARLPR